MPLTALAVIAVLAVVLALEVWRQVQRGKTRTLTSPPNTAARPKAPVGPTQPPISTTGGFRPAH